MRPITILGAVLLVAGCTFLPKETEEYNHDIVVLPDVTDHHLLQPDAKYLSAQCGFTEDIYQGARFTVGIINDYSIAREKIIVMPHENPLYSNRNVRQSKVTTFIKQLDTALSDLAQGTVPKNRSAVYISVARYLETLTKSTAKHRALYIYSDMLENNDTLDFYKAEILARIKARPQEIISILEKVHPIPDLTGISIYIMYCPDSKEANDRYDVVVRAFYKSWLETAKHATVILKASH